MGKAHALAAMLGGPFMTIPAVILMSDVPGAHSLVGGLPLVARQIKELYKHGVRVFYLCGVTTVPETFQRARLPHDALIQPMPLDERPLVARLRACVVAAGECLLVRGDCLVDPRLFAALLARPAPHWLPAAQATADTLPAVARLSPAEIELWATAGVQAWLQQSPLLHIEALDDYSPSHRGPVPFYIRTVSTPREVIEATRTLICAAQKRALDLPALLLDPIFENRLVFWLCNTRITPNQVSLFTGLLGFGIAWLFWHGWLRLGITLTFVVEILDGVDGKLARTRLQTSRLGELEHILDFFVEHAWYVSITWFLVTSTHDPHWWWIGGGLMVSDVLDNLLYGAGQALFHKQLDEMSPFDRRFRLIAGRRNIYSWMMFVGFWAGFPYAIFTAAFLWAVLTVVIHGIRLGYHLLRQQVASRKLL
jgi:phosphatidylglycerophosphate synthase